MRKSAAGSLAAAPPSKRLRTGSSDDRHAHVDSASDSEPIPDAVEREDPDEGDEAERAFATLHDRFSDLPGSVLEDESRSLRVTVRARRRTTAATPLSERFARLAASQGTWQDEDEDGEEPRQSNAPLAPASRIDGGGRERHPRARALVVKKKSADSASGSSSGAPVSVGAGGMLDAQPLQRFDDEQAGYAEPYYDEAAAYEHAVASRGWAEDFALTGYAPDPRYAMYPPNAVRLGWSDERPHNNRKTPNHSTSLHHSHPQVHINPNHPGVRGRAAPLANTPLVRELGPMVPNGLPLLGHPLLSHQQPIILGTPAGAPLRQLSSVNGHYPHGPNRRRGPPQNRPQKQQRHPQPQQQQQQPRSGKPKPALGDLDADLESYMSKRKQVDDEQPVLEDAYEPAVENDEVDHIEGLGDDDDD